LWEGATQTVFGEGRASAKIVLVGEQPGDKEDLAGKPFVGPAGKLLMQALDEVGLPAADLYFTNAVKHFGYELRGKRRLHKTPAQRDIEACRGWLIQELTLVKPKLVIALGATALKALLHRPLPVLKNRGQIIESTAAQMDMEGLEANPRAAGRKYRMLVTVHPSSILRMRGPERDMAYQAFVRDLAGAANL
jgi:DNA polymerase